MHWCRSDFSLYGINEYKLQHRQDDLDFLAKLTFWAHSSIDDYDWTRPVQILYKQLKSGPWHPRKKYDLFDDEQVARLAWFDLEQNWNLFSSKFHDSSFFWCNLMIELT